MLGDEIGEVVVRWGLRAASAAVTGAMVVALGGCAPGTTPPPPASTSPSWQSELVSAAAGGGDSGDRQSTNPAISPDGTMVAFQTEASNLGPADTNGLQDIYIRDLRTGEVTLVSVRSDGASGGNAFAQGPIFSPDGTKIMFLTTASDLGPTDTNDSGDLYVRDLLTHTTTLVSVNAAGTDSGNGSSYYGRFSPDSQKVAFHTRANDLGPPDAGNFEDVYVRDLVGHTTTLVSVNGAGTGGGNERSTMPVFSPDSTKVAFASLASDLGATDTPICPFEGSSQPTSCSDIYLRDLVTGETRLVTSNLTGDDSGNGGSSGAAFSPDGSQLVFQSGATNLVATNTSGGSNIFMWDLATGTTTLVSHDVAGTGASNGATTGPVFDADGTKLAFFSTASNLVAVDTNGASDVFVRDLVAGTTTLVSRNAAGTDSANGASTGGLQRDLGFHGGRIAFMSRASDFGPNDTNGAADIYVHDLASGTTSLVTANADGTDAANGAVREEIAMSSDGTRVAFTTTGNDLGSTDTNATRDVYVARPPEN
jgi:Tol biopolymer transport system component